MKVFDFVGPPPWIEMGLEKRVPGECFPAPEEVKEDRRGEVDSLSAEGQAAEPTAHAVAPCAESAWLLVPDDSLGSDPAGWAPEDPHSTQFLSRAPSEELH